jgi:hypothetical protein
VTGQFKTDWSAASSALPIGGNRPVDLVLQQVQLLAGLVPQSSLWTMLQDTHSTFVLFVE